MEAIEAARAIGGTDHVAQLAVSDQREHEVRYLRGGRPKRWNQTGGIL